MRVLIAEDDPVARLVLETALAHYGHQYVSTDNGRAAFEAFLEEPFPVVITDYEMPEMDGLALTRMIRGLDNLSYTYIILLTLYGGKTNYMAAMEAGVDDFLDKPLDSELLMARCGVAARILGLRQHVNRLEGLLSICAYCKRIQNEQGIWEPVEEYIERRSKAQFSEDICPDCRQQAGRKHASY